MQTSRIGAIAATALVAALASVEIATAQHAPTGKPAQPSTSAQPKTAAKPMMRDPAAEAAVKEMQQQFGFVPQFVQEMADSIIPVFWNGMKSFEMNPNTKLDAKTKELIGLAVAAQIPCNYCIQFHTEGARNNGASEQEIKEAIGMAAVTRMGSTLLNGSQVDMAQFRKDMDRINTKARQQSQNVQPPKSTQEAKNIPRP